MSAPESTTRPLWSSPLPTDSAGCLLLDESGRCLVATRDLLAAYARDGRRLWETPAAGRVDQRPTLLPGGLVGRFEGDAAVVVDTATGAVVRSFPAPLATSLVTTPWGDVAFCEAIPGDGAVLRCVRLDGGPRWALPLTEVLWNRPFPLGDLLVVSRDGGMHALDRDGQARWVVDHTAAFPSTDPPSGAGDETRPVTRYRSFDFLRSARRIDADRVLLELEWYTGIRFVLLDVRGRLEPFSTPVPMQPPYTVVPWPPTGHRVATMGPRKEVLRLQWEYGVVMLDPGGAPLWKHWMHVPPRMLAAGADGELIMAASPRRKIWNDYHQWQSLWDVTFVRCLAPDGGERWTWYAPGWQSHLPVVGPGGMVYVGCEGRLWALAIDGGSGARGVGERLRPQSATVDRAAAE